MVCSSEEATRRTQPNPLLLRPMFTLSKFNKKAAPLEKIFKSAGLIIDDKSAAEYLQEVSKRGLTVEFADQLQNADLTKFTTFTEADAEVVGDPLFHISGVVAVDEELKTTRFNDTITINQRRDFITDWADYQNASYNLEIHALGGNDTIICNHTNDFYPEEVDPYMSLDVWGGEGIDSFVKTSLSYNGFSIWDMEEMETLTTHADYDHVTTQDYHEPGVGYTGKTYVTIRYADELGELMPGAHSVVIPEGTELVKLYDEANDLNKFIVMPEL